MPYNSAADSFTQRNFVADFLQAKCDFRWKQAVLHFDTPFGGLSDNVRLSSRLIGKCVVDFLLVLIELFLQVLQLRCYKRISVENLRFPSNGGLLTQNFSQKGSPPTNNFFSHKTRLSYLSSGLKIWTDISSVLSQSTRLTERQTVGQLSPHQTALHSVQCGKYQQQCRGLTSHSTLQVISGTIFTGHTTKPTVSKH